MKYVLVEGNGYIDIWNRTSLTALTVRYQVLVLGNFETVKHSDRIYRLVCYRPNLQPKPLANIFGIGIESNVTKEISLR